MFLGFSAPSASLREMFFYFLSFASFATLREMSFFFAVVLLAQKEP